MGRRVLLKLSGEALAGEKGTGFNEDTVRQVGEQIGRALAEGMEIAVVIGGGNFWRGRGVTNIERVKADQIGMLATVMNSLYVSSFFETMGISTAVFSAFNVEGIVKVFNYDDAENALKQGKLVLFAGGTGHPYVSTDTGIALRAVEMKADEILLAKNIDGVYDRDPRLDPAAVRFDTISLEEVVQRKLQVIDMAASTICLENRIPLLIFDLKNDNAIYNAIKGVVDGTRVTV